MGIASRRCRSCRRPPPLACPTSWYAPRLYLFSLPHWYSKMKAHTGQVQDSGRTQIGEGSTTVLALGPGTDRQLAMTAHLKLI